MSIQFKRSSAIGVTPAVADLAQGELALNLADRKIFTRDHTNKIINVGFAQEYVDNNFLHATGGVVRGRLELASGTMPNASALDDLVTKRYVDSMFGTKITQAPTNAQIGTLYLSTKGGTLSGNVSIPTATSSSHAVNKQYVDQSFLRNDGDDTTGIITCSTSPTAGSHLTNKTYVDAKVASGVSAADLSAYVPKTGATLTGHLAYGGTPTAVNHLTNKAYVDAKVAANAGGPAVDLTGYLQKAGGVLTGHVTQTSAPTSPSHLANKSYVDGKATGMINGAPGSGAPTAAQCPPGTIYVRW